MAPTSYVFKLYYNGAPSPTTRRYAYEGSLNVEQVYQGLYDRAAQVFKLERDDVLLSVRDSVGNPSLSLDTFGDFVRHVSEPLQRHPELAKVDEKKRTVLSFVVQSKLRVKFQRVKREAAEAKTTKMASAAPERVRAGEQAAERANRQWVPPGARRQSHEVKAKSPPAEKGYSPAYTTEVPTTSQKAPTHSRSVREVSKHSSTNEASSQTVKEESLLSSGPTPAAPPVEAWSGVKTLLSKFVCDLNTHLADTFGDQATPFELRDRPSAAVEAGDVKADEKTPAPECAKPVHYRVYCDCCTKTIVGRRYKCENCSNYDLCEECIDARTSFHSTAHNFVEIARPWAQPVRSARGALQSQPAPAPKLAHEFNPKVETKIDVSQAAPVVHPARCDICDTTITGVRFKCLQCADWDCCSACRNVKVDEVHPHHNLVAIHDPKQLQHRPQPDARTTHRHVTCDGCGMNPIIGVRYRCTHPACDTPGGYDLCSRCEASPIPVHPHDHVMLKIREPLDPFGRGRSAVAQATESANKLLARSQAGAGSTGLTALSAGPIANLLESLGVRLHTAASAMSAGESSQATTASPADSASPQVVVGAELSDGPGEDKTLVVDLNVSQLSPEQQQGLPAELYVPIAMDAPSAVTEPIETVEVKKDEPELQASASQNEEEPIEAFTDEDVSPSPAAPAEQEDALGAVFVSDITLLDGSIVPAGSEFHKVWAVRNNGTIAWPEGTRLLHISGFSTKTAGGASRVKSFAVASTAPGEVAEVQCECKAPEESGRFMDFWRLSAPDGTRFGDRLWVDVTVEAEGDLTRAGGSDGTMTGSQSLSSSSLIAPSLSATGQAASLPPSATPSVASSAIAPSVRVAASSSGFSVPSHLAPSSRAVSVNGSEFESVQAGTVSRAGSEGVYLSDEDDESSSEEEDSSSEEESSSEESDVDEDSEADDFVVVDSDYD